MAFPNSINLNGSNQVQLGGHLMKEAASSMEKSAGIIEAALLQHQRFLDDWLSRFEALVERIEIGD